MQQQMPLHRTIMVVDVAGFTNPVRSVAHQEAVHQGMYEVLRRAFAEVGVDLDDMCTVEDRGDGAMILAPPDIPKNVFADQLPGRLVAELRRHNEVHSAEASFQLRVGLHSGEVRQNSRGAVSPAINHTFRIVDASAAKRALHRSTALLAMIASDSFYHEVIEQDPAAEPLSYRRIPVLVKETAAEAWLRVSDGVGLPLPIADDDVFIPEQGGPVDAPVLGLVSVREFNRLRGWLSGIPVPGLPTLVRRAAGPAVPPPPHGDADAWEAFHYLSDFNAGADGLPPAFVFLELLAGQVGDPLAALLRAWMDDRATHLRLMPALRALRARAAPVDADCRLHLMIVVEHDGIDPESCQLSFWRQDDPREWPPPRGETREVAVRDLEYAVDRLVVEAERAWSGHGGTAALEFVLPRALLRLPVHRWSKERSSGDPRLLCLDYPIAVRSLERMCSPHWHRVWHERWQTMMSDPSPARVLYSKAADLGQPHRIDAILNSPLWSLMVLAAAPSPHRARGMDDELTAALRAGLPALIWHPDVGSEGLAEIVDWLVERSGMRDLSARAHAAQLAAFQAEPTPFEANLARDLVVLWDSPERRVVLDQL